MYVYTFLNWTLNKYLKVFEGLGLYKFWNIIFSFPANFPPVVSLSSPLPSLECVLTANSLVDTVLGSGALASNPSSLTFFFFLLSPLTLLLVP